MTADEPVIVGTPGPEMVTLQIDDIVTVTGSIFDDEEGPEGP